MSPCHPEPIEGKGRSLKSPPYKGRDGESPGINFSPLFQKACPDLVEGEAERGGLLPLVKGPGGFFLLLSKFLDSRPPPSALGNRLFRHLLGVNLSELNIDNRNRPNEMSKETCSLFLGLGERASRY